MSLHLRTITNHENNLLLYFISDESGPAAMQHGTGSPRVYKSPVATILLGIFICLTLNHLLIQAPPGWQNDKNKQSKKEIENFGR